MGRLIITETEKKNILQKYNDDNTDKKIITYLKRHYLIVQPYKNSSFFDGYMKDKIMILIDDKLYPIDEKQIGNVIAKIDSIPTGTIIELFQVTKLI